MEWCAVTIRFPFLLYLMMESLTSTQPMPIMRMFRELMAWLGRRSSESVAPMSSMRLSLGKDAALEAYMGRDGWECPLPWALGLPAGGKGVKLRLSPSWTWTGGHQLTWSGLRWNS